MIRLDLTWCHESDRKEVGRLINRRAAITPGDSKRVLSDLADELRSNRRAINLDLTSISPDTERKVASELTDMLECEVITAGPHRDTLLALLAAWNEWRRAA